MNLPSELESGDRMASGGSAAVGARVLKRLLDVAWLVVVVAYALAVAAIVVAMAVGAHPSVTFPVSFSLRHTAVVTGSSHPASITQGSGRLGFQPPTTLAAITLAFVVVAVGFALGVLYQLRALMGEALSGSPFQARSARRVRVIGVAIIVVEVFRAVVVMAGSRWARGHVHEAGLSFSTAFSINVEVVGLGVLVVALAEVFRHGAALQTDHDLTI